MGPAGFEPATTSTPGWNHANLDYSPQYYEKYEILLNILFYGFLY